MEWTSVPWNKIFTQALGVFGVVIILQWVFRGETTLATALGASVLYFIVLVAMEAYQADSGTDDLEWEEGQ